jgi:hypothetical protein
VEKNQQLKAAGEYRGEFVNVNIDAWATEYRRHEAVVRAYFADRPDDLLVFDLSTEGWEPLCGFLGHSVPKAPFPWANQFEPWVAPPGNAVTQGGQPDSP